MSCEHTMRKIREKKMLCNLPLERSESSFILISAAAAPKRNGFFCFEDDEDFGFSNLEPRDAKDR